MDLGALCEMYELRNINLNFDFAANDYVVCAFGYEGQPLAWSKGPSLEAVLVELQLKLRGPESKL